MLIPMTSKKLDTNQLVCVVKVGLDPNLEDADAKRLLRWLNKTWGWSWSSKEAPSKLLIEANAAMKRRVELEILVTVAKDGSKTYEILGEKTPDDMRQDEPE